MIFLLFHSKHKQNAHKFFFFNPTLDLRQSKRVASTRRDWSEGAMNAGKMAAHL